ncbi:hypothetical protein B0H14DRAFT_2651552 [Mycena olivaceomarginata]|nr:hypothetical protein B0H14DRAFT_2651552 [Mycena olivaceomarginata]
MTALHSPTLFLSLGLRTMGGGGLVPPCVCLRVSPLGPAPSPLAPPSSIAISRIARERGLAFGAALALLFAGRAGEREGGERAKARTGTALKVFNVVNHCWYKFSHSLSTRHFSSCGRAPRSKIGVPRVQIPSSYPSRQYSAAAVLDIKHSIATQDLSSVQMDCDEMQRLGASQASVRYNSTRGHKHRTRILNLSIDAQGHDHLMVAFTLSQPRHRRHPTLIISRSREFLPTLYCFFSSPILPEDGLDFQGNQILSAGIHIPVEMDHPHSAVIHISAKYHASERLPGNLVPSALQNPTNGFTPQVLNIGYKIPLNNYIFHYTISQAFDGVDTGKPVSAFSYYNNPLSDSCDATNITVQWLLNMGQATNGETAAQAWTPQIQVAGTVACYMPSLFYLTWSGFLSDKVLQEIPLPTVPQRATYDLTQSFMM